MVELHAGLRLRNKLWDEHWNLRLHRLIHLILYWPIFDPLNLPFDTLNFLEKVSFGPRVGGISDLLGRVFERKGRLDHLHESVDGILLLLKLPLQILEDSVVLAVDAHSRLHYFIIDI